MNLPRHMPFIPRPYHALYTFAVVFTTLFFMAFLWFALYQEIVAVRAATASYAIFKDSSTIEARNQWGQIEFSGTDLGAVIQSAVDTMPGGGTIVLRGGTYSAISSIMIPTEFQIYGEQNVAITIDANITLFNVPNTISRLRLSNLYCKYNNAGNGSFLRIQNGCYHAWLDHLQLETVEGYTGKLIDLDQGTDMLYEVSISESSINTAEDNVKLLEYTGSELTISNVKWGCTKNGAMVEINGGYMEVTGCGFERIRLLSQSPDTVLITSNWWSTGAQYAIEIYESTGRAIIADNMIRGLTLQGASYAYGILLYNTQYCIVSNNIVISNVDSSTGISEQGTSDNNTIIGNNVLECGYGDAASLKITTVGSHTKVHHNIGYATENTVTFSSISNGTYVAHGLAAEPNKIIITLSIQGYSWYGNKNSTHIQLYFSISTASGTMYIEV